LDEFHHLFRLPGTRLPSIHDAAHVFACLFQIRRAVWHIFDNIVGESMPIARLRAAVWQSIFTHDMRRYRRSLYNRMSDVTTLITGPSGTGKELVARAIGLSQYIAFDVQRQCFCGDMSNMFLTLNLSALSPTLIESELFGHRKGAFTGAVADRADWLEISPRNGTVFLHEIGELDAAIQVKLLCVVQSRVFQRLGIFTARSSRRRIATWRPRFAPVGFAKIFIIVCARTRFAPFRCENSWPTRPRISRLCWTSSHSAWRVTNRLGWPRKRKPGLPSGWPATTGPATFASSNNASAT
jgi:hypothetical protein